MNFYTSISNKSAIRLFFILNGIFLILTILMMFKIDDYMAKKGYFILHKISKAAHMMEYTKKHNNDIIFIGHSKAQNHISTQIFKEHNYDIYTYGVSSLSFSDNPYMISKAIETNPKKIVIMVHPAVLYDGKKLPIMKQPTFVDMLKQIQATNLLASSQNILDIFPLKSYISSYKWLFKVTSEQIQSKVKNLVLKYQYIPDCEIFHYMGNKRILTLCTNGNGTVWYNKPLQKPKIIKLSKINKATVSLLNYMLNEIEAHGIKAYVLLEAVDYNREYFFDINDIYKNIHIDKNNIIDSTHLKFDEEQWADNSHVNGKAKEKVSSFIIERIKKSE